MSTSSSVKNRIRLGLGQRYPSQNLVDKFQQFLEEEEVRRFLSLSCHLFILPRRPLCILACNVIPHTQYDSDLIAADIDEHEDEISEYLCAHSDLTKQALNEALQQILHNDAANASSASSPPPPSHALSSAAPHSVVQTQATSLETQQSESPEIEQYDDDDDDKEESKECNAEPHYDDTAADDDDTVVQDICMQTPTNVYTHAPSSPPPPQPQQEQPDDQQPNEALIASSEFEPYLFELSEDDLRNKREDAKELLLECSSWTERMNDIGNAMNMIAISCHIEKPFASWLMDAYDRYKIDFHLQQLRPQQPNAQNVQQTGQDEETFILDPTYFGSKMCTKFGEYLNALEDKNQHHNIDFNTMISKAMREYNEHILSGMRFKPRYLIQDDYYEYVATVFAINRAIGKFIGHQQQQNEDEMKHDFLSTLSQQEATAIYPFQMDVWFIPAKLKKLTHSVVGETDKQIRQVEEALLTCDWDVTCYDFETMQFPQSDCSRHQEGVFDEEKHENMVKWIQVQLNKQQQNAVEIQRNRRYVYLVDRTMRAENGGIADYCLIHVDSTRIEPSTVGYFDEQCFENSKRFAFVNENRSEDELEEDPLADAWSLYENNKQLFCLSYHVLDPNTVKVYWSVGDEKTRFKMSDLWNVWPLYFDSGCYDTSGIEKLQHLPNAHDLPDHEFDTFYQCLTTSRRKPQSRSMPAVHKSNFQVTENKKLNHFMAHTDAKHDEENDADNDDNYNDNDNDDDNDEDAELKQVHLDETAYDEFEEKEHKHQHDAPRPLQARQPQQVYNSCTQHEEPEAAHVEDTEASVDSSHGISSASATSSTLYNSSAQPFDSSSSYHLKMNNFNSSNNMDLKPVITECFDEDEDDEQSEQNMDHSDEMLPEQQQPEQDPNNSKMANMIDWLHQQPLNSEYTAHFDAFTNALKEGFEDDSDFDIENVLDELNYFYEGDEDDSEIITAIKENEQCSQNYRQYVEELINALRQYTGNKALPPSSSVLHNPSDSQMEQRPLQNHLMDEAVEYGTGSKENTKRLYKVCDKHFTYYCCSGCNNGFARFIFSDIQKEQKLEILSNYFWSSDYVLRQKLIELLTQNYDMHQVTERQTLSQQLTNKDVFIDNDEQWVPLFEDVLNCKNGDILLKLSQLTCQKSAHYPLIKELRDNRTIFSTHKDDGNRNLRRLQDNVKRMRDGLTKLNIQIHLTNDELAVLYIIANDHEFQILSKIQDTEDKFYDNTRYRTCDWKAFHLNLISAIHKLKQLPDRFQIPDQLFCFTHNLRNPDDVNLYMNQITVWHANEQPPQSDTQYNCNKNTILHLTDLRSRTHSSNMQIIPIGRVLNEQQDLFLILPLRIYNLNALKPQDLSQTTRKYKIPLSANCQSLEIITL